MGNVRTTFMIGVVTSGVLLACGGGKAKPDEPKRDPFADPKPPDPTPTPTPTPAPKPDPAPVTKTDRAPEFIPPYIKTVGVGQKVSFGVPVIDQDLDETVVEVTKIPASAKFDAITQTITWTPVKADQPKAEFEIHISQPKKGVVDAKTFSIDVADKAVPLPVAEEQSAVIETLLMIRQPKRLELVNKDWPLDKLLRWSADNFNPQFTDENKKLLDKKPLVTKALFEQFLKNQADTHKNPRLDPKAKEFDKKSFGDPKSWKIVAFRPRIDKAWAELRVVYQAVNAPEPVFAMFRVRPTWDVPPGDGVRARAAAPRGGEDREQQGVPRAGREAPARERRAEREVPQGSGRARQGGRRVHERVHEVRRHEDGEVPQDILDRHRDGSAHGRRLGTQGRRLVRLR